MRRSPCVALSANLQSTIWNGLAVWNQKSATAKQKPGTDNSRRRRVGRRDVRPQVRSRLRCGWEDPRLRSHHPRQSSIWNLRDEDPISVYDRMAFLLNLGALASIMRDTSHVCLQDIRSAPIVRRAAYVLAVAGDAAASADAPGQYDPSVAVPNSARLPVTCHGEYSTRSSRRACSQRPLAAQLGSFARDIVRHLTDLIGDYLGRGSCTTGRWALVCLQAQALGAL
jgi:hypothetical protein